MSVSVDNNRLVAALDKQPTLVEGENGCLAYDKEKDNVEGLLTQLYFGLVRNMNNNNIGEYINDIIKICNNLDEISKAEYLAYLIKLAFQTRDTRGGKGERKLFVYLYLHLYNNFSKTMLNLVEMVPEYGCFRDLLELHLATMETDLGNKCIDVFVEQLRSDLSKINEFKSDVDTNISDKINISLAGKWAPREHGNHDKRGNLAKKIAFKLFPEEYKKGYKCCLKEYRRNISKLNKIINTTEQLMCAGKFSEIKFNLVPGRCFIKNKKAFLNSNEFKNEDRIKCRDNLLRFLEEVKNGKRKINSSQVFIHEIVNKLFNNSNLTSEEIELLELAWNAILDSYKDNTSIKRGVVLADVSGSMCGTPMDVSIATALFVSSLATDSYKNRFITFSSKPEWHKIDGSNLYKRIKNISKANCGMNTDFMAAIRLILDTAVENGLTNDELPEWMVVISDMQFDVADRNCSSKNNTMFTNLANEFRDAGIKACGTPYKLPTLIYWNVSANKNGFPVISSTENTIMISGFSVSVLKHLFDGKDLRKITPWLNVKNILDDKRYLEVYNNIKQTGESPYFNIYNDIDIVQDNQYEKTVDEIANKNTINTNDSKKDSGILNYISSYWS